MKECLFSLYCSTILIFKYVLDIILIFKNNLKLWKRVTYKKDLIEKVAENRIKGSVLEHVDVGAPGLEQLSILLLFWLRS